MRNSKTRRIRTSLLACASILSSALSTSSFAQDTGEQAELKEYDVELIIFEDPRARYRFSESWQQELAAESVGESAEEPAGKTTGSASGTADVNGTVNELHRFSSLEPGILAQEYRRLGLSSEVEILYYTAWRQPGLDTENAFEILLDELTNHHTTRSANTIEGSLKLVLRRYLHLHTDLSYVITGDDNDASPAGPATNAETAPVAAELAMQQETDMQQELVSEFSIDTSRRMRSKELHYIDHPLVGILVKVMPVEKPADDKADG